MACGTGYTGGGGSCHRYGLRCHLGGKAYDTPYPPASITKLLTALLVLEHSKLDEMVTFSNSAVYNVESDSGNKLNVAEGDQLSVEDCLYSLLVHSCNQAPTRWRSMWRVHRKRL